MNNRRVLRELSGPILLILLVALVQAPALLSDNSRVIGQSNTDVTGQFVPWRAFGFAQLRQGNLALWNPHLFCGTPFFGSMQSALLYPLNLLFLFLPVGIAINWSVALHVMIAGCAMYAWLRYRGISRVGSTLGGASYMFAGGFYMHIFAGHLPWLCTTAWSPLILLCCDAFLRNSISSRDSVGWILFGSLILSLQILAGYPQPIYMMFLVGSLYLLLNVLIDRHSLGQALRIFSCWILIHVIAALLCAIQLGATFAILHESSRAGGMSLGDSSTFSLPPQNFITLILPHFWGSGLGPMGSSSEYTGAGFIWEVTPFVGIAVLSLAIYCIAVSRTRDIVIPLVLIALALLIAVGTITPIYAVMHRFVPGFSHFRAPARWMWIATIWISLLAASGFDQLAHPTKKIIAIGKIMLIIAAALALSGIAIFLASKSSSYVPPNIAQTSTYSLKQFLLRAAICLCTAIVFLLLQRQSPLRLGIPFLLLLEMTLWARSTFVMTQTYPPLPPRWLQEVPRLKGQRAFIANDLNLGMNVGIDSIWGYDPVILRRYLDFMAATQGYPPGQHIDSIMFFDRLDPPIFTMLRCRCYMARGLLGAPLFGELPPAMPRFAFMNRYRVLKDAHDCIAALLSPTFNPRYEVLLESDPQIAPASTVPASTDGALRVLHETTDDIELEVRTDQPTILLMTDAYSDGWQIKSLPTSSQDHYQITPANYVLRAIPLSAGMHRFMLQYRPRAYIIGKWISIVALPLYLLAVITLWSSRKSLR